MRADKLMHDHGLILAGLHTLDSLMPFSSLCIFCFKTPGLVGFVRSNKLHANTSKIRGAQTVSEHKNETVRLEHCYREIIYYTHQSLGGKMASMYDYVSVKKDCLGSSGEHLEVLKEQSPCLVFNLIMSYSGVVISLYRFLHDSSLGSECRYC